MIAPERKPISRQYHPLGLLFMPVFAWALALLNLKNFGRSWHPYYMAVTWVVPWHLVQLWLSYRHTDFWYNWLTTTSSRRLTFRQLFTLRWPAIVAIICIPFVGTITTCTIWITCIVLYYPWQRALYNRSHQEFGSIPNNSV